LSIFIFPNLNQYMEKTNNNSQTKNNSVLRLVMLLISILAGLLIIGEGIYYVYKMSSPKQSENRLSMPTPAQSQPESTPAVAVENSSPTSAQPAQDLTGKWVGKYEVTAPKECVVAAGSWTAYVNQSGDSFSGSYKSDAISGVISGKYSDTKDFSWTVTGNGIIQLKGNVASPNAITGDLTGPTCPGTSQKITGTFSGGR